MNELKRLQKIAGLLKESQYEDSAWDMANKIAQEQFGEFGFASLSEDQMAQIVNIQKANELAEDYYGEFGFATLSEDQMEAIFEKHPDILNTDIKEADAKPTNTVTVQVPFNNIEDQLINLRDAGIKVVGLEAVPSHNNIEATLQGSEDAIRKYLAKLWFDDETATDQEEINDLFDDNINESSSQDNSDLEFIKQSGIPLNRIMKGFVKAVRETPFDDMDTVNNTIRGISYATDIEDLATRIIDYSDHFFSDHNHVYEFIKNLIDTGYITKGAK